MISSTKYLFVLLVLVPIVLAGSASIDNVAITQISPTNGASFSTSTQTTVDLKLQVVATSPVWCTFYVRIYYERSDGLLDYTQYSFSQNPVDTTKTWTIPISSGYSYDWWGYLDNSYSGCSPNTYATTSRWSFVVTGPSLPSPPHIDTFSPMPGQTFPTGTTQVTLQCGGRCPDPNGCTLRFQQPSGTTINTQSVSSCSGINCFTKQYTVTGLSAGTYSWRCRITDSYSQSDSSGTQNYVINGTSCGNIDFTSGNAEGWRIPSNNYQFDNVLSFFTYSSSFYLGSPGPFTGVSYELRVRPQGGSWTTVHTDVAGGTIGANNLWYFTFSPPLGSWGAGPLEWGKYYDWQYYVWDDCRGYANKVTSPTWRYSVVSAPNSAPQITLDTPPDGTVYPASFANTSFLSFFLYYINDDSNGTARLYLKLPSQSTFSTLNAQTYTSGYSPHPVPYTPPEYGTYQWYVNATDGVNPTVKSPVYSFQIANPSCPNGTVINVPIGMLSSSSQSIGFTWYVNTSAITNSIDKIYLDDSVFYTSPSHPTNSYYQYIWNLSQGIIVGKQYKYYVNANWGCGNANGPVRTIGILCPLKNVDLMSPLNGVNLLPSQTSVVFVWNSNISENPPPGIQDVNITDRVYLSDNNGPFTLVYTAPKRSSLVSSQNTTLNLQQGHSYRWYVTTEINDPLNECGITTSPVYSFSISQPLQVILSQPSNGQTFVYGTKQIPFTWTVSSSTGQSVIDRLYINGILNQTYPPTTPGTRNYLISGFRSGGYYTAYVTSTDSYGTSTSNSVSFYINCTSIWINTTESCQPNNKALVKWTDLNDCLNPNPPKPFNDTYVDCVYCSPTWYCSGYDSCSNNLQKCNSVLDENKCCEKGVTSACTPPDVKNFDKSCVIETSGLEIDEELVSLKDPYTKGFLPSFYSSLIEFFSKFYIPLIFILVALLIFLITLAIYEKTKSM